MSMPYSPTSPRIAAMADFRSDQKLPPITKLPDIYHHARPQSPPTSPESITGSSQSSPKRRMSDRNEIHDLLDGNRRKRSATSTQVLGPAAAAREQFDDSRREPRLPSPTGMIRPEDRPKLPPLQTYLRSCHADVDTCSRPLPSRDADMPWTRDRSNSGANGATLPTLPRIVTSDFPPASRPVPTDPIAYATSKSSYSGSRSTLSSPHSTSPTSYAPPSSYPSAVNASYGRSERDPLRPTPAASDPARSHSLSSTNGESVSGPYEPYAAADRRYSTGYIPPHAQRVHGAPPTSHYATMPPPPHGAEVPAHYVWEMPVAAINPNGRKRRGNLPKESTSILNDWFCQHITFPYPKEDEKHQLQAMTGLSISQISNWFINARRRRRPEAVMRQSQAQYDDPARWKHDD